MERQRRLRVERLLRPGERLLWVGAPDPAVRFRPADGFLVPFSILWGGFALFWEGAVLVGDTPLLFKLWGIPFVVVGLYFMVGRFVLKARRKRRTTYFLTDRRAAVAVGEQGVSETPGRHQGRSIRWHRDRRHVSVTFGGGGDGSGSGNSLFGFFNNKAMYANTGMELFGWGQTGVIAFYDVVDGKGLIAALDAGAE